MDIGDTCFLHYPLPFLVLLPCPPFFTFNTLRGKGRSLSNVRALDNEPLCHRTSVKYDRVVSDTNVKVLKTVSHQIVVVIIFNLIHLNVRLFHIKIYNYL